MFADGSILFWAERSAAIVVERQEELDQVHRKLRFRSAACQTGIAARP
jgi:hypothetical protein